MSYINPIFHTDSYKLSHKKMTSNGVETIYSNYTPRFDDYMRARYKTFDGGIVWFGMQYALRKILVEIWRDNFFNKPKEEVIAEAKRFLVPYIGMEDLSHFEDLHDLGYLPLEIKALPEGSVITKGIPCFTITNTHKDYQWLPNYLESILSTEIWKPMTTATIGRTFRKLVNKFAMETEGNLDNTDYQLHDFSLRGQSGVESAAAVGGGFLLSTKGTDNVPALAFVEHYYDSPFSETFNIANSVPAGEHGVTTLGIQLHAKRLKNITSLRYEDPTEADYLHYGEVEYVKEVLKKFDTGIVSYVADSYDYFSFLDRVLPAVKNEVMARDGKFVVRGDSGDPVEIIAGVKIIDYSSIENYNIAATDAAYAGINLDNIVDGANSTIFSYKGRTHKVQYNVTTDEHGLLDIVTIESAVQYDLTTQEKGTIERLWEIFGGTVNELGYKVLDSHIGMIYGDGITEQRATEILTRLKDKGFVSTCIVFGIGSYTLNMISRDDLGTAIKATSAVVNGERVAIYKEPKTDTSKKSARGLLCVTHSMFGGYELSDNVTVASANTGLLQTVWKDGEFVQTVTFDDVIKKLNSKNGI